MSLTPSAIDVATITDSDDGRAFEVTAEGDLVWSFVNPNLTDAREPSVIVRTRRFEGLDYAELEAGLRSGRGPPVVSGPAAPPVPLVPSTARSA